MEIAYPDNYVVWDLETTGFNGTLNDVLEIAALVVKDGKPFAQHNWVLDNKVLVPAEITEITGITNEIISREGIDPVKGLIGFSEVLSMYGMFTVAHNGIRFDSVFMKDYAAKLADKVTDPHTRSMLISLSDYMRDGIKICDTAALYKGKGLRIPRYIDESFQSWAKRVLDQRVTGFKYNLAHCCDELGIDRTGIALHRAAADVEMTNLVYRKLTGKDL